MDYPNIADLTMADQIQEFPDFQKNQKRGIYQVSDNNLVDLSSQPMQKSSNDCLIQKHVKPHPFAFISAVKKKFAKGGHSEICKKVRESEPESQIFSQSNAKMDFIKPLKVPDLKISPKTLDYSLRECSSLSEASLNKFDLLSKDCPQKEGKTAKTLDRVQRKLDFSSSNMSLLNDENDDKTHDAIAKKDHFRDNSREKENKSKRIKKDDSLQNVPKRVKNTEHVCRKDISGAKKIRNESYNLPRETEFLKKQKTKLSASLKREEDKRHRCSNSHHKSRSFSNDTTNLCERNANLDKSSTDDCYKDVGVESSGRKGNEEESFTISSSRLVDDDKKKVNLERQSRPSHIKEQMKRTPDKSKSHSSIFDLKYSACSDLLEGVETASNLLPSIHRNLESQGFKITNVQNDSKNEDSSVRSDRTQADTNAESKSSADTIFSEMLLDPRRISFRDDSYSQQEEFSNLTTPDINLMLRSKRRKQFLQDNSKEDNYNSTKNKPTIIAENKGDGIQLLHPTALHMQFQAELNLLDSFNESLRQVMDVESSIYNAKHAEERVLLQKEKLANEKMKKQIVALQSEREMELDKMEVESIDTANHEERASLLEGKPSEGCKLMKKSSIVTHQNILSQETSVRNAPEKMDDNANKRFKSLVKVSEVQTQTANDIATQTDVKFSQSRILNRLEELSGITYQRGPPSSWDIPRLSLESLAPDDDFGQVDDISLTSKMRGMSEISLHETTSSIKTETGTEISISTRDVTCSFNKDLALEMAQLIQDEKQRYDKIKMLFKSREKILNDRTKKLVKLEEQKRQLRDTGQDSRISSVKKKQRALLLKLQQEKDEMNRLKELHKIASQERKLMLQKQRDMFNPEMSTKNILTKLKRSADSQSPRRLSGPMKGYDIRSNSSMSSLVDSDKSQMDRLQDTKPEAFNTGSKKDEQHLRLDFDATSEKSDSSKFGIVNEGKSSVYKTNTIKGVKKNKYDIKARKFEEKMPRADIFRQIELHSQLTQGSVIVLPGQSQNLPPKYPAKPTLDYKKSESDTATQDLCGKSKYLQLDPHAILKPKAQKKLNPNPDITDDIRSKKALKDNLLQINCKDSKKVEKPLLIDSDTKNSSKRKGSKSHKTKSTPDILVENFLRSKSDSQVWEKVIGHHNKRSKLESDQSDDNYQNSILEELDFNESQSSLRALLKHSKSVKDKNYQLLRDIASDRETKENMKAFAALDKKGGQLENFSPMEDKDSLNRGNISTRSQVSTLTISHHSSGDSEKSYSRSVVIRSQNHRFKTSKKLQQILNAREAALASRRTCVEEWIAWHTRLREEENRVARMEQATYKLVNTASKALSYHDTTVSSDASDVEGRIELLAQKLADRRTEMARLKKEAKRQAKQRLRAMEASLLNQIKKYDATIHEMRKTLETKKESIKTSEKAAIESKSVTDFKVPDIPIKRIHEIYKSSDLLQTRSTSSDLINNNSREKMNLSTNQIEKSYNKDAEHLKLQDKVASNQLISEEEINANLIRPEATQDFRRAVSERVKTKFNDATVVSEVNFSSRTDSSLENSVPQQISGIKSVNESLTQNSVTSESVLSDINTLKSKTEGVPLLKISLDNTSKSLSSPEISEFIDPVGETVQSVDAENIPLSFSRKLDYIGLNSQNLNDDISTLESDLKKLSEMMLQISKKSTNKAKLHDEENVISEKRTSEGMSEYLPASESDQQNSINDVDDIVNDDIKNENSSQKIDYNARSKEMLNEIEKSILSDHIKSLEIQSHFSDQIFEEGMRNLHKESEVLSNDLTSLEGDIKSISEMISKASQSKDDKSLNDRENESENCKAQKSKDSTSSISKDLGDNFENSEQGSVSGVSIKYPEENTKADKSNVSKSSFEEGKDSLSQDEDIQKRTKIEEGKIVLSQDEDIQGQAEIEDIEDIEKASVDEDWTISDSFELQMKENTKGQNKDDSPVFVLKPEREAELNFAEIDFTTDLMFLPWGESTNIETLDNNFENVDDSFNETQCENKKDEQPSFTGKETIQEKISNLESSSEVSQKNSIERKSIVGEIEDTNLRLNEATSLIGACFFRETGKNEESFRKLFIPRYLPISELEPENLESHGLPQLELESREIFPDDFESTRESNLKRGVEIRELNSLEEQDSSEGEQLDNLVEVAEDKLETLEKVNEDLSSDSEKLKENEENMTDNEKAFSVLKNPQYEDISEESLEISLILDKIELPTPQKLIPEKYESVGKAENVAKILDEILAKSESKIDQLASTCDIELEPHPLSENEFEEKAADELEENSVKVGATDESSESSEGDAQKINFEIQVMTNDPNDSRLDMDALDDDLLSGTSIHQNVESNADFHAVPIVTNAEKDIIDMIDKLKASLSQPGLEVAELDATLLRIEQLQIELEIKRLEAEEVSYYVREIPNKPPPPYTPPGTGLVTVTPQGSPSPPAAVIPTNVDDLTAFTEKATSLIFFAREGGQDIMSLEAPAEIWELSKDTETLKKDRRIYNTFLFDLCKETITEVYRMQVQQPGPSWTRPIVKTKPAIQIPKNVKELTEYVNKEVATLFGFKTKLQRENMVMRWSRKRRDRVDELLAREAQAEEDEWTKFHCDELAVKNELTVAILDTLILETVNVVKAAFTTRSKLRV